MAATTTRLAPSPTGALHLGNARTFLVNYLLARQRRWRVLMRVEDLDGPRVKAGAAEAVLETLAWLGLTWEEPIIYQSRRQRAYRAALDRLIELGAAYPCTCSRKDIEAAASAPHRDGAAPAYPGTCRGRYASGEQAEAASGRPAAWRLRVNDEPMEVRDEFVGVRRFDLSREGGDFVVYKNAGQAAYQLAVVVDDAAAGVDAVVRGDDLLDSAARQDYLRRLLGLTPQPRYWHLPLVIGPDGRRLAKRHGDTRLEYYRERGASPQRILGLLGFWCGLLPTRREAGLDELQERFDLALLPKEPVVFSPTDDDFLLGARSPGRCRP